MTDARPTMARQAETERRAGGSPWFWVRCGLSLASLAWVLHSVEWRRAAAMLADAQLLPVLAALCVHWLAQAVSAWRCAHVATALGRPIDYATMLRAQAAGLWWSQFLPSCLGGDVVRTARLAPLLGWGVATRSMVLDRLSGLFVLCIATLVLLPVAGGVLDGASGLAWLVAAGAAGGAAAIVLAPVIADVAIRGGREDARWRPALQALLDIAAFRAPARLLAQLGASAAVHVGGIAVYALLARSLGLEVRLEVIALLAPLVFLVSMLPVSAAGWGVREAGAVWLFGVAGMQGADAFALSFAYGLSALAAAVPGMPFAFAAHSAPVPAADRGRAARETGPPPRSGA